MAAATPTDERKVDLNRGVQMRRGPDDGWCCMYKDDPGVYFSETLEPRDIEYAKSCGFDVDDDTRKAELSRRMREAETRLRVELGLAEEEIRAQLDDEVEELVLKTDSPLIVARNDKGVPRETEFHLMEHRGQRKWDVIDKQTGEPAIEPREEEYALDWMIRQAEERAS